MKKRFNTLINKFIHIVNPELVDVISDYFGLEGPEMTFKQLGEKYYLSHDTIRKLIKSEVVKIIHFCKKKK